jgi:hypothetical protein
VRSARRCALIYILTVIHEVGSALAIDQRSANEFSLVALGSRPPARKVTLERFAWPESYPSMHLFPSHAECSAPTLAGPGFPANCFGAVKSAIHGSGKTTFPPFSVPKFTYTLPLFVSVAN